MGIVLDMLWHQRGRYLPAVFAVSFSALLIALQCGLLLGLFSIKSIPVDRSPADLWIGSSHVESVDMGRSIPTWYRSRVESLPGITRTEVFLQGFAYWAKPDGGAQLCMVVGGRLGEGSLGNIAYLPDEIRARLATPNAIVVDASDLKRLGITGVGARAHIGGEEVHVVGVVNGLPSFAGPYVICSVRTARSLLHLLPTQTIYLLARCRNQAFAREAVRRLRKYDDMTAFTSADFSWRTRMHWMTTTKGGIALGYAAVLGLLVGAVVTAQTLYAATAADAREYAVLRALGIPAWRLGMVVVTKAFWVGIVGVVLSLPAIYGLVKVADMAGVQVQVPFWLLAGASAITLVMALISGLFALRSLQMTEPITLLR